MIWERLTWNQDLDCYTYDYEDGSQLRVTEETYADVAEILAFGALSALEAKMHFLLKEIGQVPHGKAGSYLPELQKKLTMLQESVGAIGRQLLRETTKISHYPPGSPGVSLHLKGCLYEPSSLE